LHSLNLMLPKEERKAMLLRIFDDNSPLIDHSQQRREAHEIAAAASAKEDPTEVKGAEPETFVDQDDGGVKLNADVDEDMDDADATAPVGASGVGTEDDALATEDRLLADQQVIADEGQEVDAAPEREGEEKAFNTTV